MNRLNGFRAIPVVLSLTALALSAAVTSCIKEKDSLVIVAMTSDVMISDPINVHITVGNVTQVFLLANGLSPTTATERGVYIDSKETGNLAVSATTQDGTSPCIVYRSTPGQTVAVPSAGSTVTTSLTLVQSGTCGGTSDGGVGGNSGSGGSSTDAGGDHPGSGGAVGTGGGSGTGGAPGTGGKGGAGGAGMGGAGVGGAGGTVIVAPPSLSRCFEIHHSDITCDMSTGDGDSGIFSVVFSPDGKLLLSAGDDGRIRFWKIGTGPTAPTVDGRELTTFGQGYMAFSHNGQYLAAGDFSGDITVWSMSANPTIYATLSGHSEGVDSVWFSPDDTKLVSVGDDMQLIVWSMATRASIATVPITDIPWWVRVSPLATATTLPLVVTQDDGSFVLMNALANPVAKLPTLVSIDNTWVAEGVAYAPDGKSLLVGSQDGSLSLWTGIATNQPVRTTPDYIVSNTAGTYQANKAAAFFPDGAHVASASGTSGNGGQLKIFETTTKHQIGSKVPTWYFLSLDVSPDGGGVAAGEVDCGLVMYCHD